MDQRTFTSLIKDILNNYYDSAALEAHPLAGVFAQPGGNSEPRSEYVRAVIREEIEGLRPPQTALNPVSAEWRPYLLLQKRYIEGLGLKELCDLLAVGDRQLRRDHHRALLALTGRLWRRLFPGDPLPGAALTEAALLAAEEGEGDGQVEEPAFAVHKEAVDLVATLRAVLEIVRRRADEEGLEISADLPEIGPELETDRIILRQILVNVLHEAIRAQNNRKLRVSIKTDGRSAQVQVEFSARAYSERTDRLPGELDTARYWCAPVGASLEVLTAAGGEQVTLLLRLPLREQRTVLVIDDQTPVINMFRRFLAHSSSVTIAGATQAEELFPLVHQLHPALIILDVMMPQVDGWEMLQRLKLNEDTRAIPVVVCSAWAAPDLAYSLGAAAFLKKPVTQKAFLDVLAQVGLK